MNLGLYNVDYHTRMQYEEDSRKSGGEKLWERRNPNVQRTYQLNVMEDVVGTGVDAKSDYCAPDDRQSTAIGLEHHHAYVLFAGKYRNGCDSFALWFGGLQW